MICATRHAKTDEQLYADITCVLANVEDVLKWRAQVGRVAVPHGQHNPCPLLVPMRLARVAISVTKILSIYLKRHITYLALVEIRGHI